MNETNEESNIQDLSEKNPAVVRLRQSRKRMKGVGDNLNSFNDSFTAPFSRYNYDIYDFEVEPDKSEVRETLTDPTSGAEIPYRFTPRVLSKWRVEYFNTPYGKARLARHAALAFFAIFVMLMVSITISSPYVFISIGIFVLLLADFLMRYYGVGFFYVAAPEIPFFTNFMRDTEVFEFENLIEGVTGVEFKHDYDANDDEEEEEVIESQDNDLDIKYVPEVNNYNNGNPSPATILSSYMNKEMKWTQQDLEDKTGGVIDSLKFDLLMQDNDLVWTNDLVLDSLSKQTNSTPKEWLDALDKWRGE